MAISTNVAVDFFGTQTSTDDGSTSAISDGSFSVAADLTSFTNTANAKVGAFVLRCQFATLPTDNSVINLYGRKMNVQGTNDTSEPDAANTDQFIGSFTVDGTIAVTNDMFLTLVGSLPNIGDAQVYDFYLQNETGQTITLGWAMWITQKGIGPTA